MVLAVGKRSKRYNVALTAMMKLFGISLTLVLSALMAEIGEAAQAMSEQTVWAENKLGDRQWPVKSSSFLTTDDSLAIAYGEKYQLKDTVAPKQETKQTEADQLFNEATDLFRSFRWQEAFKKLEQALILYREIGDRQGEGRTLIGFGAIADNLGQYPQALDYYEQSLVISREIGDRAVEGLILNNIGGVYDKLGQYPEALDYCEQSLVISREIEDRAFEGLTLNNIGEV